jgi:hypothetical protein
MRAASPASADPRPWKLSTGCIGIIIALTLWHALGGPGPAIWGIAAASMLIVIRERRSIPRSLALTGLALGARRRL